jgi:hypothetical protein
MVPNSGSRLPIPPALTDAIFAHAIGDALQSELGASHRAAKTVMGWTRVSDRTAREWLHGRSSPNGRHLILLATHCRAVMAAMLRLSGHSRAALAVDLETVEDSLEALLGIARKMRSDDY